jgi:aminopeptidase YwaD
MTQSIFRRALFAGLLLAFLPALPSLANSDPIGLVTVSSHADAEIAEQLLGSAFARTGNRFLVSVDPAQKTDLAREGLVFEELLTGESPDDVYLILSLDHPRAPELVDLDQLGHPIDIGDGLRLMAMSRASAASLSETSHLRAVRLSEHSIDFKYTAPTVTAAFAEDTPLDYLADLVEQDSLFAYTQRLQDFHTRYTYTDSCQRARDWIENKFESFGYSTYDVTTPSFYYGGSMRYNVMARKLGTVEPDKVIVVGGHYDAVTYDQETTPWEYAPGADDNGSGTALTLECARLLADVPLRKTIYFIAFDAEEVGLVGAWDAAGDFANAGTPLEVMFNYDMIGYNVSPAWDLNVSSGDVEAYKELDMYTTARLTDMTPLGVYLGSSSDHYPFYQEGFNVVNHIETEFNYPGWHTNLDLTSEMDFPYMTEVVKGAVVSLAIIADSPYPATVDNVIDVGDGQSLDISWSDCATDCSYYISWGDEPGIYTDSVSVPAGQCDYTLTGLSDGVEYHILVIGETPSGYRGIHGIEGFGTPYTDPRTPQNLIGAASGEQLRLNLSWTPNNEVDLSHYNVYRRIGPVGTFRLLHSGLTQTSYADLDIMAHVSYSYQVTAVDHDGNESGRSTSVTMMPATFDGGPVIVDAFCRDQTNDPEQAEQHAFFDSLFGDVGFSLAYADEHGGPVLLGDIGPYSSMFWIDDDNVTKNISASGAAIDEFSEHNTNLLIAGFGTFYTWADKSVPTDHVLYREFMLSSYDYWGDWDFIGGFGQNGWPDVAIDPARGPDEWRGVAKMVTRPGAEVIYTFNSLRDRPEWEGEPCGIAYDGGSSGKRVLLSFPIYYLTPSSSQALMAKVLEYFGGTATYDKGDLDDSGTIDIVDLALLIDHLFIHQAPLADPDAADMDGNPGLSLGDAYYLVMYLFGGGPAPVPGES